METARHVGPRVMALETVDLAAVPDHYNDDDPAGCTYHDNHDDSCARCLIAAGLADDVTRHYYTDHGPNAGRLR